MVNLNKDVFTTFEVAKICGANITSIKNWIEQGELKAFRTPGGHYRVEKRILIDFLSRHEMPNPFRARERFKVFILGSENPLLTELRDALAEFHDVNLDNGAARAVLLIAHEKPDVLLVDVDTADVDTEDLFASLKDIDGLRPIQIVVLASNKEARDDAVASGARFALDRSESIVHIASHITRLL